MILIQSFFKGPLFYLPGQLIIIVGLLYAYRYYDLEVNWLNEKMGFWRQQNESKALAAETQTPSTP